MESWGRSREGPEAKYFRATLPVSVLERTIWPKTRATLSITLKLKALLTALIFSWLGCMVCVDKAYGQTLGTRFGWHPVGDQSYI